MRSVLFTTLAGLIAVAVIAGPKPASATPVATVLKHTPATASEVIPARRWYKKRRYYRRPYYRPYRSYRRPYYRPYRHYRPYRYYGRPYYRPYRYYRRPRVGVYVGI